MIAMLRTLALLSALAATSFALTCYECTAVDETCTEGSMTCGANYQCGNVYTQTIIYGLPSTSLIRTCVLTKQCNFQGSFTTPYGPTKMSTKCCNTDDCDPADAAYPAIDYKANGVVCRSCASPSIESCHTSDTISCTGKENMCVLQATKITTGTPSAFTVYRGCATKSICDLGRQTLNVGDLKFVNKFTCPSGGLSVHKVVLTPAILCLLLLKIFF